MSRRAVLKEALWVLAAFGAVAIVARLFGGLGAVTDLSDAMPWGLWKILNMVAGVALATCGFTMAAIVYVFHRKHYRPLLKPAILLACLGYGASCFALFLDIGLPHAIWKPMVYWNHHSFLFEVAWCVMLYFTITLFETAPVVLERSPLRWIAGLIHKVTIPLVIVGITLSTLHHTSLGSLFLVMPARLHPLWFTNWIPVLFFFSAVGAGLQTLVLVVLAYRWFYGREVKLDLVSGLAKGSAVVLGIYFVLKLADLALRGQFHLLTSGEWESGWFIAELLLGALIPVAILAFRSARRSPVGLALAALSAVSGLVLNRLNVGIMGLLGTADVSYFPTFAEICLSVGIIAMAGLVFVYLIEYFPVFEDQPARDLVPADAPSGEFAVLGRGWAIPLITARARASFLFVVAASLAMGLFAGNALRGIERTPAPVEPPLGVDEARHVLLLDGNRNMQAVAFDHRSHQLRLKDRDCGRCHHMDLPKDQSSACYRCHRDMRQPTSIFSHNLHVHRLGDKWSCRKCHGDAHPKHASDTVACRTCHEKDMGLTKKEFNFMAPGYADAMHASCVPCHEQKARQDGRPVLAECACCHDRPDGPSVPETGIAMGGAGK